jgi:hypothetical protein
MKLRDALRLKQALNHSLIKGEGSKKHKQGNTYAATEQTKPETVEPKPRIQQLSSSSGSRPPPAAGYLHNRGLTQHEARMLLLDKTAKVVYKRANLDSSNVFSDLSPQRERLSPIMKDAQAHCLLVQRKPLGSPIVVATRRKEKEPTVSFPQTQPPSNKGQTRGVRPKADAIPIPMDAQAHAKPSAQRDPGTHTNNASKDTCLLPKMLVKMPAKDALNTADLVGAILAQPLRITRRNTAALMASLGGRVARRDSVRAGADRTFSAVHGSYVSALGYRLVVGWVLLCCCCMRVYVCDAYIYAHGYKVLGGVLLTSPFYFLPLF